MATRRLPAFLPRPQPHRQSRTSVCTATAGRKLPGAGTGSAGTPPTGGRPVGAPAGGGRWVSIHSRCLQPRLSTRNRCRRQPRLSTRSRCRPQPRLSTRSHYRRPPQGRRGPSAPEPPGRSRAQRGCI